MCAFLWPLLSVWGDSIFAVCQASPTSILSVVRHVFPILIAPACYLSDRVKKVVGDFSLLVLTHRSSVHAASLSTVICALNVAVVVYSLFHTPHHHITTHHITTSPHHQITRSSACRAALMTLWSSASRSLIKMRKSDGETMPP